MGQQEVYEKMRAKKEFMDADQIARLARCSYAVAIRSLNAMFRFGEVEREIKEEKRHSVRKIYIWKIKIKK